MALRVKVLNAANWYYELPVYSCVVYQLRGVSAAWCVSYVVCQLRGVSAAWCFTICCSSCLLFQLSVFPTIRCSRSLVFPAAWRLRCLTPQLSGVTAVCFNSCLILQSAVWCISRLVCYIRLCTALLLSNANSPQRTHIWPSSIPEFQCTTAAGHVPVLYVFLRAISRCGCGTPLASVCTCM